MRDNNKPIQKRAKTLRRKLTRAEAIMWNILRQIKEVNFRRQVAIDHFIADFAAISIKLIIEVDGSSHFDEQGILRDAQRTKYLENLGFEIIRVRNIDAYENAAAIGNAIALRVKNKLG